MKKLPHFVESQQLDSLLMGHLFGIADEILENPSKYSKKLNGKGIVLLFYEPSTRTRFSFELAMKNLGGRTIMTEEAGIFSSAAKGETIEDTVRVIGGYLGVNAIVIRHKEEGYAMRASKVSPVPIINAGDGRGQHPTQALLDLYTIYRECGEIKDLNITLMGDLRNGRTVKSLCYLLGKLDSGNKTNITFVSPPHLSMEEGIKDYLKRHSVKFTETSDVDSALKSAHVIYMTRVQKERMSSEEAEHPDNNHFRITRDNFELIRKDAKILHPLPRVDELNVPEGVNELTDPRTAYFRQAHYGVPIRMALLHNMLRD